MSLAWAFTHIEFLPSWPSVWRVVGLSAARPVSPRTRCLARRRNFALLIDRCHNARIGILLDWVPAHFRPTRTDWRGSTALRSMSMPTRAKGTSRTGILHLQSRPHRGTLFLIAERALLARAVSCDGIRVDAVAAMLYRDYRAARTASGYPIALAAGENLEAVAFLQELRRSIDARCPGAILGGRGIHRLAGRDATARRGRVSASLQWNMGWMHDTLDYIAQGTDPSPLPTRLDDLRPALRIRSGSFCRCHTTRWSNGKRSLLGRMPRRPLATFRQFGVPIWASCDLPGKKLLFMAASSARSGNGTMMPSGLGSADDPAHRGIQGWYVT